MTTSEITKEGKEVSLQRCQKMLKELETFPGYAVFAANWWLEKLKNPEEDIGKYHFDFIVTMPVQKRGITEKDEILFKYTLAQLIMESVKEKDFCLLYTTEAFYACPILEKAGKKIGLSPKLSYYPKSINMVVFKERIMLTIASSEETVLWAEGKSEK